MGCGCGGSKRPAGARTAPATQGPSAEGYYWQGPDKWNGPEPKQAEAPAPEPEPAE